MTIALLQQLGQMFNNDPSHSLWCLTKMKKPSFTKPKKFDTNLVVIGAGSGGLVSAYIAAAVKAKVVLIEQYKMGGDCLNSGCVPSKALLRSASVAALIRRSSEFGIDAHNVEIDFSAVMERVRQVILKVAPHDSIERYNELGVEVIIGHAQIVSPWHVEINQQGEKQQITTRSIIIAAGAKPFVPPIPGIQDIDYITSDTVWSLQKKPKHMLVLGGGPIGCELAQAFCQLGIKVTLIEMLPRLLIREDPEVSELLQQRFQELGIQVLTEHKATQFMVENQQPILIAEHQGNAKHITFDQVLIAIGRSPNVSGYGIEEMGIKLSDKKTVAVNAFQQTNYPNIYACGDVAGPYQFTHTAAHQAWYASVNALFGCFKKFKTDYSVIPWVTFTEPEIARVGLNESDAKQQSIAYETSIYGIDDLDRALADSEAHGFVKVLTVPGKDKILGVTIVGHHAGDLLAEFVLAMKYKLGLNKILGTIHVYPTMSEANKYTAGVWKKQHQPVTLLKWVERYHAWRRKN